MSRSRPPLPEFAQAAYAAYGAATGHRTYDDRPMPAWDDLGEHIQAAWVCAAGAVSLDTLTALGAASHDGSPEVGDIVLVLMDPADNNGATEAPAIVTRVWSQTTINARVLADSHVLDWRTSLTYVDSLAEVDGAAAVWTWPGAES
jgi:hypothetical protein